MPEAHDYLEMTMKTALEARREALRRELVRVHREIKRTQKRLDRLGARLTFFEPARGRPA